MIKFRWRFKIYEATMLKLSKIFIMFFILALSYLVWYITKKGEEIRVESPMATTSCLAIYKQSTKQSDT